MAEAERRIAAKQFAADWQGRRDDKQERLFGKHTAKNDPSHPRPPASPS